MYSMNACYFNMCVVLLKVQSTNKRNNSMDNRIITGMYVYSCNNPSKIVCLYFFNSSNFSHLLFLRTTEKMAELQATCSFIFIYLLMMSGTVYGKNRAFPRDPKN